jgi:hypothetical protein
MLYGIWCQQGEIKKRRRTFLAIKTGGAPMILITDY